MSPLLSEIFAFEFEDFLLFFHDLLLALGPHGLREEDLLRLVVGSHDACVLLRRIDLLLPPLGEHRQLFIRLLVLRQVFEDIRHVDIGYRLVFSKSRATSHYGNT